MSKLDEDLNTHNPNFSSLLIQKQVNLEKYVNDKVKTKTLQRTNSENDLLLQLNSLSFPKIVSTDLILNDRSNLSLKDYDDASYYISKDETFSLPQIGSKFLFEEDQATSEYNAQLRMLKNTNRFNNDSKVRSIKEAITYENDLKHLLKTSLHNKRLILIIEQYDHDFNEFSSSFAQAKNSNRLLTRRKPINPNAENHTWPKDFPLQWKFEFMFAIKYGSFGHSNLVYSQAFKIMDKRKYFFMKKLGKIFKILFVKLVNLYKYGSTEKSFDSLNIDR
jgi:hypothetical protein